MKYIRYGLFYPAIILFFAGSELLLIPAIALSLLQASGIYDDAFVRLTGGFL
ncbi:MAG: hypothetical protein AAF298_12950 [Cyanobacteria bacterium P01_A01_bin.40]